MLSNKSSAVWASATSTQGVGETDWNAYQLSLTGNSQQFSLVPGQSTSTSLVILHLQWSGNAAVYQWDVVYIR